MARLEVRLGRTRQVRLGTSRGIKHAVSQNSQRDAPPGGSARREFDDDRYVPVRRYVLVELAARMAGAVKS